MSASLNQIANLQSGPSGEKKKKKKKVSKGKGSKIIDDDIDLNKVRALDGDELDILGEGEDAQQISGKIDETPEEAKTSSKWRVINQDDGINIKIKLQEIKKDIQEVQKHKVRAGDPMLDSIRNKKQKKPKYKGKFPLNRFSIRPGHRWDGVDRSNGYEKEYFLIMEEQRTYRICNFDNIQVTFPS